MCRLRIGWVGLLAGLPFSFCLCLSGSCWLQAASPIIHPHQHTRVPSPAPPKFLTIHTHRLTHPHTHTLTLSHTHPKHNHLRVHSLTHLLAHSLIHSFTLPVTHSLTHELITFALPHYASRGTQNDSKLATHVVGWHMSPVPSPILSSPASLGRQTCRQSTQQVVV